MEQGRAQRERLISYASGARAPLKRGGRHERNDREPRSPQQSLLYVLVHSKGRSEDTGADVGNVGKLQQPLECAVLSVGPVHNRKDDIQAVQRRCRTSDADQGPGRGSREHGNLRRAAGDLRTRGLREPVKRRFIEQVPGSAPIDADEGGLKAAPVDGANDRRRRRHDL